VFSQQTSQYDSITLKMQCLLLSLALSVPKNGGTIGLMVPTGEKFGETRPLRSAWYDKQILKPHCRPY
jgi:hypothetical protein